MKVDLQFPVTRLRSDKVADQIFHYFIFFKLLTEVQKYCFKWPFTWKKYFKRYFPVDTTM